MLRPAEPIGLAPALDIAVVGGYLLLTAPLEGVIRIVPSFVLVGLVIAASLFTALRRPHVAPVAHRSGKSKRSVR